MLRTFYLVILFPLLMQGQVLAQSSCDLHVASFNIHYIVPHDKGENWNKRKHAVARILKDIDADIIAFQEMETFDGGHYSHRNLQLDWINSSINAYENAAVGDPESFPSTQPILYKPIRFSVVAQGFFFFAETPDKIYARQWDGRYPYFCSWVRFHSKCTGKDFYVFNVHNDYKSRSNRLKTSALITNRIQSIVPEGVAIIVLGDFNASKRSKEIRLIESIGLNVVKPDGSTFRKWGLSFLPAIDHILVSKEFEPLSEINVWRNRYDGIFPSDHYPISVKLTLRNLSTGSLPNQGRW